MPSGEVDTASVVFEVLESGTSNDPIMITLSKLPSQGKTLFVPKVMDKHGRMDCMKIYDKNDLLSLPSGVWGIKEPDAFWQGEPRLRGNIVPVSVDRTRRWFDLMNYDFFGGKLSTRRI